MNRERKRVRLWARNLTVAGAVIAAAALWQASQGTPYVRASGAQIDELTSALLAGGIIVEFVPSDEWASAGTDPVEEKTAVAAAVGQFGSVETPVLYRALVTAPGVEPAISDRPMYVIQLTGQALIPQGGRNVSNERLHRELVVFVDALSGELVFATSIR